MTAENMRNKAQSVGTFKGKAAEESPKKANFCLVILLRPNKHFSSYKSPKADDIDKDAVTFQYVNIYPHLLLTLFDFDGWRLGSLVTLREERAEAICC